MGWIHIVIKPIVVNPSQNMGGSCPRSHLNQPLLLGAPSEKAFSQSSGSRTCCWGGAGVGLLSEEGSHSEGLFFLSSGSSPSSPCPPESHECFQLICSHQNTQWDSSAGNLAKSLPRSKHPSNLWPVPALSSMFSIGHRVI